MTQQMPASYTVQGQCAAIRELTGAPMRVSGGGGMAHHMAGPQVSDFARRFYARMCATYGSRYVADTAGYDDISPVSSQLERCESPPTSLYGDARNHPSAWSSSARVRYTVMVQPPTYVIRRADYPPALEAAWDSPDWSAADVVEVDRFHPKSSTHRPRVQAKLLYDDRFLYVQFRVFDRYVRCIETNDQDKVYHDSCAELFVQPGEDASRGYFNFEMNCGGALLLYHIERPGKASSGTLENFSRVDGEWLKQIRRFHTLPRRVEPEMTDSVEWRVAYLVPMKLFEAYVGPLSPPAKRVWRGNFFKCADATSHPHWGMWSPVEVLNFHQPDKFGELRFAP